MTVARGFFNALMCIIQAPRKSVVVMVGSSDFSWYFIFKWTVKIIVSNFAINNLPRILLHTLSQGIMRYHTFTVLLIFPSQNEPDRPMVPHGQIKESLNARRYSPSHKFKSFMWSYNLMKSPRYIRLHELVSSRRVPDTYILSMMVVINSGSIALGVLSTILWCRNTRIGISFFLFLDYCWIFEWIYRI